MKRRSVAKITLSILLTVLMIPSMVEFAFADPEESTSGSSPQNAVETEATEPSETGADAQAAGPDVSGEMGTEMFSGETETTVAEEAEDPTPAFCKKAPSSVKIRKLTGTSKKITWKRYSGADGYQVQYTRYRSYRSKTSVMVKDGKTTSLKAKKLKKKKVYFARVRAFKKTESGKIYSRWGWTSNNSSAQSLSSTKLKYKKQTLNIRKQAGLKKSEYSTLQGGCTDGKYAYMAFAVANSKFCNFAAYPQFIDASALIVKLRLSDHKVIGVSDPMPIGHANALTYNKHKRKIIVTNNAAPPAESGGSNRYTTRLSIVNPSTLAYEGYVDVEIPDELEGATWEQHDSIKGFCGVAYCPETKQYAVNISETYDFMVLNEAFEPVRFMKAGKVFRSGDNMYAHQQMDVSSDFIMTILSPKGTRKKTEANKLAVYTWDGRYMCSIKLVKGYEVEHVFHIGTKQYHGYYDGHYYTNPDKTRGFAKNAFLYRSIF